VEEVKILQKEAAEALEARLEGRVYFHGDEKPSTIDLILAAFLANGLGTEANPHWKGSRNPSFLSTRHCSASSMMHRGGWVKLILRRVF
jgi:hypothetical protein